ncbi:MAG: hypothetical protein U0528_12525 [Anaerolineae bacterium]
MAFAFPLFQRLAVDDSVNHLWLHDIDALDDALLKLAVCSFRRFTQSTALSLRQLSVHAYYSG